MLHNRSYIDKVIKYVINISNNLDDNIKICEKVVASSLAPEVKIASVCPIR